MIVRDDGESRLERVYTGPRVNHYTMIVAGWYGGGFSARSDTEALEVYRRALDVEEARPV